VHEHESGRCLAADHVQVSGSGHRIGTELKPWEGIMQPLEAVKSPKMKRVVDGISFLKICVTRAALKPCSINDR